MTNTALPPLPRAFVPGDEFNPRDFYTADQMQAYAQEAVRAALASKPDARMHAREAAAECQHWHGSFCGKDGPCFRPHCKPQSPPAENADFGDPRRAMTETELQEFCIALSFEQDDYTEEVIRAVEDRMLAKPLFVAAQSSPVAPDVEGLKAECKRLVYSLRDEVWQSARGDENVHVGAKMAQLLAAIDALSAHGVKQPEPADALDAKRYRWLREQHEGHEELAFDADGLPTPMAPTALAFTVFRPDETGDESLVPVGCIPGELDEAIDAAMSKEQS
jgi:hypothetical protein